MKETEVNSSSFRDKEFASHQNNEEKSYNYFLRLHCKLK